MKCWKYEVMPRFPARFYGKVVAKGLALVDTGAKYCVIHPDIASILAVEFEREETLYGFGSKEPIKVEITSLKVEVDEFMDEVEVACIDKELYPDKAPKMVIGMNFIRRFSIMLTGNEVCIEGKGR